MGGILMAAYLSRNDRIKSELGKDARRERRFYLFFSILAFIPGAFALWEINYEFWNIVGSVASHSPDMAVAQAIRMLPLYLAGAALIFFLIYTNGAYRAKDQKARGAKWCAGGIVMIVLGVIIAAYVVIGVLLGEYGKIIEGYITPLFPLDMLLAGVIFIGVGFLSIRYSKVIGEKGSNLPYVNDRGLFGWRLFTFGLLRALCLIAAMLGFAGCIWGISVLDLSHGYLMYSIVLWLNYLTAFAMYIAYRYIFCETKPEIRGTVSVKLGAIFLIVNIVLFALHLLTVEIWNEAPDQAAYGILPADFLTSMNIFAVFYGINNILAPIAAIARGLVMEKKNRSIA
ncbi:MAG: hypothetical protein J5712_01905 [Lachnospiraceae bacterium]|nr:hypothetical protein [Lachnospiraceae bacterium]